MLKPNFSAEIAVRLELKLLHSTNRMFNLLGLADPAKNVDKFYKVVISNKLCHVEYHPGYWLDTSATAIEQFFDLPPQAKESFISLCREHNEVLYQENLFCTKLLTPLLAAGNLTHSAYLWQHREKRFNVSILKTPRGYHWGRIIWSNRVVPLPVDVLSEYFDFESAVDFSIFQDTGIY